MLSRPGRTDHSRGQALVETALVLPILALLLVMAIDFGRVFFGWVALQNAARIGADYAAQWSDAWETVAPNTEDKRDRYIALIEAEVAAINCDLATPQPPDPIFEDGPDTGPDDQGDFDDGDRAIVELECEFSLITPLAEGVFGGPIATIAHEEFPIHQAIVQGVPEPPEIPECVGGEGEVPDMVGETLGNARDMWVAEGFAQANFQPSVVSTGPPRNRNVNHIVSAQSLTAGDCEPITASVTLTAAAP